MENVRLVLSAIKSDYLKYGTVMFTKFFNMIFIGEDGQSLNIYTAVIFSARPEKNILPIDFYSTPRQSSDENTEFKIKLQYDGVKCAKFSNLTDSFISQAEILKQIWGCCTIIEEAQLSEIDKKTYISKGLGKALCIANNNTSNGKGIVAIKSNFEILSEQNSYTLSAQTGNEHEYISWIKAEIQLEKPIIGDRFSFRIDFNFDINNWTIYCPDYTWYICTPQVYSNEPNEMLVQFADKKVRKNMMQPLNDQSALNLQEWLFQENINKCRRCRLLYAKQKEPQMTLKNSITIEMFIDYAYDRHGNKQFFEGLIVAFLISYVADWTKLVEILKIANITSETVVYLYSFLFPITVIEIFLVSIVPLRIVEQKINLPYKKKTLELLKFSAIVTGALGLFLFFCVIPILSIVSTVNINSAWTYIVCCMCFLSIFLSMVYFLVIKKYRGISIYNYL